MTTYNTYQEAKIANPECDVFTKAGKFIGECDLVPSPHTYEYRGIAKCNPADHCMTVEKFLADGSEFVEGDLFLNFEGVMVEVGKEYDDGVVITTHEVNRPLSSIDCKSYILRAAALENQMNIDNLATQTPEEKEALDLIDTTPHQYEMSKFSGKPRTKVEYVKCEFDSAWEAVKDFEDGKKLYTKRSHKDYILIDNAPGVLRFLYDLHEPIEIEIDERQEFIDAACDVLDWDMQGRLGKLYDSGKFKLVESN